MGSVKQASSVEARLAEQLRERATADALRSLSTERPGIDLSSNDYLGIARKLEEVELPKGIAHGATGSRLLTGNYPLIEEVEQEIARFHGAASALIYSSGYAANVGLFSCIAQRGDTILYDELVHASIRDGLRLSLAKTHAFAHNDLQALEEKLKRATGQCYIAIESIYSMDGDEGPLKEVVALAKEYNAAVIVDEAHAVGMLGAKGEGAVSGLGAEKEVFARIVTFGKALGCHGAAVLGSTTLRNYLVNYSRSFIYSTGIPEASVYMLREAYGLLSAATKEREMLAELVQHFLTTIPANWDRIKSNSHIQTIVIPGNEAVMRVAQALQTAGYDVLPIRYPTVPEGQERIRICLHAFNTKAELDGLIDTLKEAL